MIGPGDKVVCLSSGLESFGLFKGNFYTVSQKVTEPLALLLGPVVSISGVDENVFFPESSFELRDTSFEDELIKNLFEDPF